MQNKNNIRIAVVPKSLRAEYAHTYTHAHTDTRTRVHEPQMQHGGKDYEDTAQKILSKLIRIETTLNNMHVPPTVVYTNTGTADGRNETVAKSDDGGSAGNAGNADATLQVIRRVSSPMDVSDVATIERIVENSERLRRALDGLVEEARDDDECREAASLLAGRLRWFLEDLNRSDGQLDALLAEYDKYRKAYYRLRRTSERRGSRVSDGGSGCWSDDGSCYVSSDESDSSPDDTPPPPSPSPTPQPQPPPLQDSPDRDGTSCAQDYRVADRTPDGSNVRPDGDDRDVAAAARPKRTAADHGACCRRLGASEHSGLYECPGMLDVTKCNHGSEEICSSDDRAVDGNVKPDDWKAYVKKYCCFCLPFECTATLSMK